MFNKILIVISFACLQFVLSPLSNAATYYVDPVAGSMTNDGSEQSPWHTLEEVINNNLIKSQRYEVAPYDASNNALVLKNPNGVVEAGDTVVLLNGYHGEIELIGYTNDDYITITNKEGHTPRISKVLLRGAKAWRLEGLDISPEHGNLDVSTIEYILYVDTHSWHGPASDVHLDGLSVKSVETISGNSASEWETQVAHGIYLEAVNSSITNSQIKHVNFGLQALEAGALLENNSILNFTGDAINVLGSNSTVTKNLIANAIKVDDNHDDGIQSFTRNPVGGGTPVANVVISQNTILHDLNHPAPNLMSNYQGIGAFDGFFDNWLIENNLVSINDYHGITLLGARNTTIRNNTIVDAKPGADALAPWIWIGAHKNGQASTNNTIINNVAYINSDTTNSNSATLVNNINPFASVGTGTLNDYFVDPAKGDYRLKKDSPAAQAGDASNIPASDLNNSNRSAPYDVGAIESSYLPSAPSGFLVQ